MSFRRINAAVALLANVVAFGVGVRYLIDQQEPLIATVSMIAASVTAIALHAIACIDRFTDRRAFQILASSLAVNVASFAIIDSESAGLVYESLLLSTIFSMMAIYAGCRFEDRVERRNVDLV